MIDIEIPAGTLQAVLKRAGVMSADITDVNLEVGEGSIVFTAVSFGRDRQISGLIPLEGDCIIPIGNIDRICDLVGGKAQTSKIGFSSESMIHITSVGNKLVLQDCDSVKRYEVPFTADNVILSISSMKIKREGDELFVWSPRKESWGLMGKADASFKIVGKTELRDLLKEGAFKDELHLTATPEDITIHSTSEDTTGFDKVGVELITVPDEGSVSAIFTSLGELFIPLLPIAKDSELTCFLIDGVLLYVEEVCEDGSKYTYTLMARTSS